MKIIKIIDNIPGGVWWFVECECGRCPGPFLVEEHERSEGFVKCRYCGERFDCATIFVKWEAEK